MDQDEKTESGIRQQARDLFGSAGGRARAKVRLAHGFIQGRPRYEQVLIIGMLSFAALLAVLIVYLIILIPLTPGVHFDADRRRGTFARVLGSQLLDLSVDLGWSSHGPGTARAGTT